MNKEDIIKGLNEIDNVLAQTKDPALTRQDHASIMQILDNAKNRVSLSFDLEKKIKEMEESKKEEVDTEVTEHEVIDET
jgi:hypothetical protein